MRMDLDSLERIVKAGDRYGHNTPGVTLELIAEVRAWRERFPAYVYRPQDECVASRMWLERKHEPVECSQWRWKNGMDAPKTCARCGLGPCREISMNAKEKA